MLNAPKSLISGLKFVVQTSDQLYWSILNLNWFILLNWVDYEGLFSVVNVSTLHWKIISSSNFPPFPFSFRFHSSVVAFFVPPNNWSQSLFPSFHSHITDSFPDRKVCTITARLNRDSVDDSMKKVSLGTWYK